jgi:serine/threonine-protein kinase
VDATLQDPLVGQLLDGRYRVGPRLARGGMATVYEAVDSRLDRTIALKVMHANLAEDEEFVHRFIREAKSAARLSHPNVVAVYDQGADAGHVFLAMEHVSGRTLRDLIRERGPLSPRQALEVIEPVLAALGAAHRAGIIHRDVKPENVLLSDEGRVKVADFGLARTTTGATSLTATTGVLLGTVAYLSPEQVERGIADARSDVYAAGILLYEMLTGRKPYDGESAIQVAYRHVHEDVPPPSALVPLLPPVLDEVVARATSRDPDQRPADAHRFLSEVVSARRSLPDTELDVVGPAIEAPQGPPEHTLVVPATEWPTGHTPPPAPNGRSSRRGDTGPLPPPRRRRLSRGWIAFLVVMLLTVGLSGAAWYLAAGPGAYTTTPALLNLTQDRAVAKAERAGFTLRVTGSDFSETVPAGRVLETDPAPRARVRKDATIKAVVSKGPERYAVPDVTNRTRRAAVARLEESNLTVGEVSRSYSDTVRKGRVISSDPAAGTELKRDQAVNLVVSRGVKPVPVPDVTGEPIEAARAAIAEAGLSPVVAQERNHPDVPKGSVISQSPADGMLLKGSDVQLVVSKGPPLVTVPDVTDQKVEDAARILREAGFEVETRGTRFLNRVFRQSPGSGDKAPKGSTVTITTI